MTTARALIVTLMMTVGLWACGDDGGAVDSGPAIDVGHDAGSATDTGAPVDVGTDAGTDAGVDAGADAGFDAGADAGVTSCPPGTEQTAVGPPPTCDACSVGTYCEGGVMPSVACGTTDFDDDMDPATACVAFSDCAAGTYVDSEGDATNDRVCFQCDSDGYSTMTNASMCTPKTDCIDNEYVSNSGTDTTDRECTMCPANTTSIGPNAPACLDPCELVVGVTCAAFEQAYLKASNTGVQDFFGISADLDGDTLVIGANYESSDAIGVNGVDNDSAFRSGAAYVFVRTGTTWAQQAFLKASNTGAYDYFGESVAIDGDTIIVGAYGEDSSASGVNGDGSDDLRTDNGAAYIFVRNGTAWTQQAFLKASNNVGGGRWFGRSVDISGDTAAVAAWHEPSGSAGVGADQTDTSLSGSGAVYVFTRSGTTWTQQEYIKASNPTLNDEFGVGLAINGDTLVVGAPSESSDADGIDGLQNDESATYAGAVYVFARVGTVWSQQAYVKASNSDGFDYFGRAVDIDGDTMVVGAPGESSTAAGVGADQTINTTTWTGAVYVFTRAGTVWTQQEYIKAAVTGVDRFGASVSLDGDVLAVGAPREGGNGTDLSGDPTNGGSFASGAAYLFRRAAGVWTQTAYIKASNTDASDGFGVDVSVDNGTMLVTAELEQSNATGVNGDQSNDGADDSGAGYVRTFAP